MYCIYNQGPLPALCVPALTNKLARQGVASGTCALRAHCLPPALTNKRATVKPTGVATTWGSRGKPTGKRATIKAAILAGGSLASIVAVSKANGASFAGLADVVVAGWQGVVTFSHK